MESVCRSFSAVGGSQDKASEQLPHLGGAAVHTFRVPLDADSKGVGRHFNSLNGLIGSGSRDGQILSDPIQGLMVVAVHI